MLNLGKPEFVIIINHLELTPSSYEMNELFKIEMFYLEPSPLSLKVTWKRCFWAEGDKHVYKQNRNNFFHHP
jgi:hypothetical protein